MLPAGPSPSPSRVSDRTKLPETNRSALFRPEVMLAQRRQAYGSVLVLHPLSHAVLTLLFSLLAAALIAFVALFGFHRKVTVEGVVAPDLGLITVQAQQAGVVSRRLIHQGQMVQAGEPLFLVNAERVSARFGDTEAAVLKLLAARRESLALDITRVRGLALDRHHAKLARLMAARAEIVRIGEEIDLQQRRSRLAEGDLSRFSSMQQRGYVSIAAVQEKEALAIEQRLKLADLNGSLAAARQQVDDLNQEIADDATQAMRDADTVARSIAEVDSEIAENEAGREIVVRAPLAGSISSLTAEVGQNISAAEPLAAIVPARSHFEALLYAPSEAAGFIRPGMQVLLRYESFPFQKFGLAEGRVEEVADAAVERGNGAASGAASTPVYRVRVALMRQDVDAAGKRVPLKAGMRLQASIVLEERRLYEWILEPIFALKGRL